jgi:Gar1/Naf1 RNA binding region
MAPPFAHERRKRQWNNANETRNHHHSQQQQHHHQQHLHQQHLQVANDLAIAATYAQMEAPRTGALGRPSATASTTAVTSTIDKADSAAADSAVDNNDDDNEISLEEEDGSSDSSSSPESSSQIVPSFSGTGAMSNEPEVEPKNAQDNGDIAMNIRIVDNDSKVVVTSPVDSNVATSLNVDDNGDNDGDEDDESDVDLAEAVARMEQEDDDGEDGGGGGGEGSGGASAPPKTANEVNAYHVTVKQLEKVLGTSLSTREWEEMHIKAKAAKLEQAGHVHYHLVDDRTIVVQSMPGVLLEEGNILVIKKNTSSASLLEEEMGWMPLGKIFEVFGPVSRPFYSVRLPDPPERKSPPDLKDGPEEGSTETVVDATSSSDQSCAPANASRLATDDDLEDDPWEPNGKYTLLFRSSPKTLIYYLMDEATLINTNAVYQASGRGCDASNIHDEEVLNPKDMYYSDDEQEREATGKQRAGRKHKGHQSEHPSSFPTGNNTNNPSHRNFGGGSGGDGGGHGFIRPNDHHPYHRTAPQVPGFHHHHSSPAIGTTAVSGFVRQPHPMMIANNNSGNSMTLPPFNGRTTTGQVSASYTNNNAWHAGSIPQPAGQQQSTPAPAEDTVYYDYS